MIFREPGYGDKGCIARSKVSEIDSAPIHLYTDIVLSCLLQANQLLEIFIAINI